MPDRVEIPGQSDLTDCPVFYSNSIILPFLILVSLVILTLVTALATVAAETRPAPVRIIFPDPWATPHGAGLTTRTGAGYWLVVATPLPMDDRSAGIEVLSQ